MRKIYLIIILLGLHINLLAQAQTDTLVGSWSFNEGTANDESGNNNHGTVNGATLTTDRFSNENSAYAFDGVDDYIEISNSELYELTKGSISVWFNTATSDIWNNLTAKANDQSGFKLGINSYNQLNFMLLNKDDPDSYIGTYASYLSSTEQIIPGNWYHAVVTFPELKGQDAKIYLNGALAASQALYSNNLINSLNSLSIGHSSGTGAGAGYFNGTIDQVKIYNYELSETEIQELYSTPNPKQLVGSWSFNEGTANDESSNNNHGTVNGATLTTDRFGNENSAYSFDGVDDYIEVNYFEGFPFDFSVDDDFTISAWFNLNEKPVDGNVIGLIGRNHQYGMDIYFSETQLQLRTGVSYQHITPYYDINMNEWYQVVFKYESNKQMSYYVNGQFIASENVDQVTDFSNTEALMFGKNTAYLSGSKKFFNGKMDDINFYNYALSQSEIDELYNAPNSNQLIGSWTFNDGTANDESGNGNTGTVNGATLTTDRFGNENSAYSFDGIDDAIQITDNSIFNFENGYTYSLWVYNSAGLSGNPTLISRGTQGSQDGFIWVYTHGTNETNLRFQWNDGVTSTSEIFYNALGKDVWNHVVFTFDKTSEELKLFVDGIQIGDTKTLTNSTLAESDDIWLGMYRGVTNPFEGKLDNFQIYNYALSATEIQALYNAPDLNEDSKGGSKISVEITPSGGNYIIEKIYHTEVTETSSNTGNKSVSINYFDGLGRASQSIQIAASPDGKDMIQHIAYDEFGRETKKYLPYASITAGGSFRESAETEQDDFYKTAFNSPTKSVEPWSDIVYEESPLNRILEQGAPGSDFQTKGDQADNAIHFAYQTNEINEVKLFGLDTYNNLIVNNYHNASTLYKTGTRDENGIWSYEYKDVLGQVLMKESDPDGLKLRTYYVYDDYGNLRYVIPPKAVELITQTTGAVDTNIITNLCYYYEYDGRKRMTMKQLPGADPVYMIYDQRDRLVLTQDGNQRTENKWMFTKYDALNRPVITGIYDHGVSIDQDSMQNIVNTQMTNLYEEIDGNYTGADFGYTNRTFPILGTHDEILTVTYYDNYLFDQYNILDYMRTYNSNDFLISEISYAVKGQVTATKIKVLGTDNYITTINFYDDKYRVIRTYSDNYLGGNDITLTKYDFIGNVLKTKQIHYKDADATTPVVVNQRMIYDHANRLTQVYHQIEGNEEMLIAEISYNELGELIKKKLNQNANGSFLQEIDYEYNIRGWRTKINDPAELQKPGEPKDMFAMELHYNSTLPTVNNTGDEQYNGNIAAVKWNTPEFGVKAYGYGYDEINRLERAKFAAGSALDTDVDKYSIENITYDANGNILTLGRHNTAAGYIDNLTMTYDGNQLKKKHDSGDLVLGFVDMVDNETEYHYDNNGSMYIDDNKGIIFAYNHLNLPKEIVGGNDTVRYIYDAAGIKISKELVQGGSVGYTDYVGDFVYKDGELDYIIMDEGRITQPTAGTFQYEYYLTDHLGNTRTVFADGNGDGVLADNEVLQENHYYPFGMQIGDLAVDRGADNKIKFGAKELQDDDLNGVNLALIDFGARFLDDFRWDVIDNKAEKYYSVSPYVYAVNNPILFIDPDGNEVVNTNNLVVNNSNVVSLVRVLNDVVATRTGLENNQFTIRIAGGDRYKDSDGNIYSMSNDEAIPQSASASRHLIEEGARAIDLQIDNDGDGAVTSELLREILEDLGVEYIKDDYDDGHTHAHLSADQSEQGLTTEDKNRPTTESLNSPLTNKEKAQATKAVMKNNARTVKEIGQAVSNAGKAVSGFLNRIKKAHDEKNKK